MRAVLPQARVHTCRPSAANCVVVSSYSRCWLCLLPQHGPGRIKRILCEHLDLMEIEWRPVGRRHISIARRASVARLDEFVGPKR
jgi:hypothetical protein